MHGTYIKIILQRIFDQTLHMYIFPREDEENQRFTKCLNSVFRRCVNETSALLRCYAA